MRGGRDRSTLPALYSVENIELQQESFKLYNDWLYDWCSADRKRLVGVLLISVYDVKGSTNAKTNDSANTLFDFIFYGYFERMPKLKLLLAESEIGWMPFLLQQWGLLFRPSRQFNPQTQT